MLWGSVVHSVVRVLAQSRVGSVARVRGRPPSYRELVTAKGQVRHLVLPVGVPI